MDRPQADELLEQAVALLEALMAEREAARLVNFPPQGATLRQIERDAIEQALERAQWVQRHAAALLGVSGRVLNHLIHHRHKIRQPARPLRRWRKGAA